MVVFDSLGDVDDPEMVSVDEDVVLTEISVDESAVAVHRAHDGDEFTIPVALGSEGVVTGLFNGLLGVKVGVRVFRGVVSSLGALELLHGLLELGGWVAVAADVLHDQDVLSEVKGTRRADAVGPETHEVSELFFGPQLDHLPGVVATVALSPTVLSRDVLVTVLEDEDGGLVDLDGKFLGQLLADVVWVVLAVVVVVCDLEEALLRRHGVVDVGLLSGGDAAVDRVEEVAVEQLEEDETGAGIEDEFTRGTI
mmetsp:Transcript_22409/g.37545  ORF Transcript_22409/g.37545 Transcript_22409/m.37545 type:complete len:253 (-) Transcript_22409:686-1444(-)